MGEDFIGQRGGIKVTGRYLFLFHSSFTTKDKINSCHLKRLLMHKTPVWHRQETVSITVCDGLLHNWLPLQITIPLYWIIHSSSNACSLPVSQPAEESVSRLSLAEKRGKCVCAAGPAKERWMNRLEMCLEVIADSMLQYEASNLGHGPAIRAFVKTDVSLMSTACLTSCLSLTERKKTVAELVLSKPTHWRVLWIFPRGVSIA